MHSVRGKATLALLLLVSSIALAACGESVPDRLQQRAKSLKAQIGTLRGDKAGSIKQAETTYKGNLKTRYGFMLAYTSSQQHLTKFDEARTAAAKANEVYDREVAPTLEDYADKRRNALEKSVKKVEGLIQQAKTQAAEPAVWAGQVQDTKTRPDAKQRELEAAARKLGDKHEALSGKVNTAKRKYPQQKATLDRMFGPYRTLQANIASATSGYQAENAKRQAANYAVMTTYANTVFGGVKQYDATYDRTMAKVAELDQNETRTIVDGRIDPVVTITRTSWDDYYDWPTEHDFDYPERQVDLATANYFADKGPDAVLGGWSGGKFQLDRKTDKNRWATLKIDPRQGWKHDGDDAAEYYAEVENTYCIKYWRVVNGKPNASARPTDDYCAKYNTAKDLADGKYWVEGEPSDLDNMFMDDFVKPVGVFAAAAMSVATPPGLAYVGQEFAGHWEDDGSGGSIWIFTGYYAGYHRYVGGPHSRYTRAEYDYWRKHPGQAYYGWYGNKPRFGAKGFPPPAAHGTMFRNQGLENQSVRAAAINGRSGGLDGGGK